MRGSSSAQLRQGYLAQALGCCEGCWLPRAEQAQRKLCSACGELLELLGTAVGHTIPMANPLSLTVTTNIELHAPRHARAESAANQLGSRTALRWHGARVGGRGGRALAQMFFTKPFSSKLGKGERNGYDVRAVAWRPAAAHLLTFTIQFFLEIANLLIV